MAVVVPLTVAKPWLLGCWAAGLLVERMVRSEQVVRLTRAPWGSDSHRVETQDPTPGKGPSRWDEGRRGPMQRRSEMSIAHPASTGGARSAVVTGVGQFDVTDGSPAPAAGSSRNQAAVAGARVPRGDPPLARMG